MGKDTGKGRAGRQRDREPEEKGRAEPDRLKEIPIGSNVSEGEAEDNQLWPGKQLCASFANPSSSCCALLAMLWPCPTQPQAMHIMPQTTSLVAPFGCLLESAVGTRKKYWLNYKTYKKRVGEREREGESEEEREREREKYTAEADESNYKCKLRKQQLPGCPSVPPAALWLPPYLSYFPSISFLPLLPLSATFYLCCSRHMFMLLC